MHAWGLDDEGEGRLGENPDQVEEVEKWKKWKK